MIELKQLQMLEAISREGTISGAAKLLGYSQPAISQHVATIERKVGTPVLVRGKAGVRLTEAGQVLVEASVPIIAQVEQTMAEVEAIAGMRAGRVRVSCFPSGAALLLPPAFASVRATYPGLSFVLSEREPADGIEMLRRGKCDLAIVFDYETSGSKTVEKTIQLLPNEVAITIFEEEMMVALPEDHALAEHDRVDLSLLNEEEWIAGCPKCRTHLIEVCGVAGFYPHIELETDDHLAMQGLVGAGLGISLIPEISLAVRHQYSVAMRPTTPASKRIIRAVTTEGLMRVPGVVPTLEALKLASNEIVGVVRDTSHQKPVKPIKASSRYK